MATGKRPSKRKRTPEDEAAGGTAAAVNGDSHLEDENNTSNNHSLSPDEEQKVSAESATGFLRAMELIDTHGVLDVTLKSSQTTLRALLQDSTLPTHAVLYNTFTQALSEAADTLTDDYSALEDLKTFSKTFSPALSASVPASDISSPNIPTRPRYVLHRSLANGVDLFSHAAPGDISQETLKQFNTLRDTDLLAVHDSIRTSLPHTTLDSISKPTKARPTHPTFSQSTIRVPSQTATLYYNAFSSFAPSYDSSGSSEPYGKTMIRRNTHTAIKKWLGDLKNSLKYSDQLQSQQTSIDPDLMETTEAEEKPSMTTTISAKKEHKQLQLRSPQQEDDFSSLLEDEGLLEKDALDAQLKIGSQLLINLQIKQWQRLRLDRHLSLPGQDDTMSNSSDVPDEAERTMANILLKHLASCIPRTFASNNDDNEMFSRKSLIPSSYQIRQLRRRILQPSQPIYQGLLDPANASGIKETTLNAPSQTPPSSAGARR